MALISQTELAVAEAQRREWLATAARFRRGMPPRPPRAESAPRRSRRLAAAVGTVTALGGRIGRLHAAAWRGLVAAIAGQGR